MKQFKNGQAPKTEEDRASLEGAAYKTEEMGEDYFHNLESGSLSGKGRTGFSEQGHSGLLMKKSGNGPDELLEDFSGRSRKKMIEVIMEKTGARYVISPEEKDKILTDVRNAFDRYVENKFRWSKGPEKKRLMNKLSEEGFLR